MRKDESYLADILRAAEAIQRFTSGVTADQFKTNEEKYEAVIRKFEIIGEAARHLSPSAKALFPQIPWKLLTAMRNILIHDYDDIDLDIVWHTVERDIPPLIAAIKPYLAKNTGGTS